MAHFKPRVIYGLSFGHKDCNFKVTLKKEGPGGPRYTCIYIYIEITSFVFIVWGGQMKAGKGRLELGRLQYFHANIWKREIAGPHLTSISEPKHTTPGQTAQLKMACITFRSNKVEK